MSAEIIEFIEARARRSDRGPMGASQASPADFTFWQGASATRYVHTVHSLLGCPELPPSTFVLCHRAPSGEREVLAVGQLIGTVPSLNLAEIRHRGARLGANEIHVHLIAATPTERARVVHDLKAAWAAERHGPKVKSAG